MQRKITNYLIAVCYSNQGRIEIMNFIVTIDIFPSKRDIENYMLKLYPNIVDITIMGITPMTDEQTEQYGR